MTHFKNISFIAFGILLFSQTGFSGSGCRPYSYESPAQGMGNAVAHYEACVRSDLIALSIPADANPGLKDGLEKILNGGKMVRGHFAPPLTTRHIYLLPLSDYAQMEKDINSLSSNVKVSEVYGSKGGGSTIMVDGAGTICSYGAQISDSRLNEIATAHGVALRDVRHYSATDTTVIWKVDESMNTLSSFASDPEVRYCEVNWIFIQPKGSF